MIDMNWKPIHGYKDPPAIAGYEIEVERDCFLGLPINYRYRLRCADEAARAFVEGAGHDAIVVTLKDES